MVHKARSGRVCSFYAVRRGSPCYLADLCKHHECKYFRYIQAVDAKTSVAQCFAVARSRQPPCDARIEQHFGCLAANRLAPSMVSFWTRCAARLSRSRVFGIVCALGATAANAAQWYGDRLNIWRCLATLCCSYGILWEYRNKQHPAYPQCISDVGDVRGKQLGSFSIPSFGAWATFKRKLRSGRFGRNARSHAASQCK